MAQFQNSNIVFRCPASLKEKMKIHAADNEMHLSAFIRAACMEKIRREQVARDPNIPGFDAIQKRLWEIGRLSS